MKRVTKGGVLAGNFPMAGRRSDLAAKGSSLNESERRCLQKIVRTAQWMEAMITDARKLCSEIWREAEFLSTQAQGKE